jgi:hypothetical protein
MNPPMSKQLAISSVLSVLLMATYALLGPHTSKAPADLANPVGQAQAATLPPAAR